MTWFKLRALHRVTSAATVLLFALFAGNIVLVTIGATMGFTTPRLSTVAEFLVLLATTGLGTAYLIGEERRPVTKEEERP